MNQINNTYGSGGMSVSFNDQQFSSFVQFLKGQEHIEVVKAAQMGGEQACGKVWIMGSHLQLDDNGMEIDEERYKYIWYSPAALSQTSLLPIIKMPLTSNVLRELVSHLASVMKHNFISSLLILAGGVMQLHYSKLQLLGGCPIIVAQGRSETGKSTALRTALALLGIL